MAREMRTWKTRQLHKIEVKVKVMSEARNATQGRITQIDPRNRLWGNSSKLLNMEKQCGSLEKTREDLGGGGS